MFPQVAPAFAHRVAVLCGAQPQTPAVPVPPHVSGDVQVPHEMLVRVSPQLSVPEIVPQFALLSVQNAVLLWGVHPQTLAAPPPPQVWGDVHVPQVAVRETPHASTPKIVPHVAVLDAQKAASVGEVHPHALGVPPPPQVWGEVHVPQVAVRTSPQLSGAVSVPQAAPAAAQNAASLCAVQAQTFAVPLPPQVCGDVQVPHA